ncbi:MAG TPA: TonB-dependent receptor [Candidatus Acidoferrales bacterium]|nr:TonB-dependent receptor [Candidatus Acidoferrales bacterium]
MKLVKRWHWLFVLAIFLAAATTTLSQSLQNGAVHGTVYDTTKAEMPGVKLTLTNLATGITRQLTSEADGGYDFENVAPGEYNLTAVASGFATTTVKQIQVTVGASVTFDVTMPPKTQTQSVEVTADTTEIVDTSTSGVTQLVDSNDVQNLPFPGRDYRDLALLTPSVQVVPGLRGGIRMGGQQSDYSGLSIDGADMVDNFFGENFGSLETKNLTIPLEAVQEFQVVTNGFAPEFGRATGGLLNVVSKSGGNELHGEAHEYYRGGSLTANDALGNPSNISNQNQFGGSAGFPIRKDRQFLFVSTDIQRESGPLKTVFCPPSAPNFAACEASLQTAGPIINPPVAGTTEILPAGCSTNAVGQALLPACYGVPNLAAFEGSHTQYQNFFTLLGHYDYQVTPANHLSIVGIGTRNHTNGFTGGQGQTESFDAYGNTENFVNQGVAGIFAWTTVMGRKVNEIRAEISGETRKRHAIQSGVPEIQITGVGNFGQRFYLPANNDAGKLQVQDNFSYSFGKHDMKFGGDIDTFADKKDVFAGWSAGQYNFSTVQDFNNSNENFFIQGFGLNNVDVFHANLLKTNYQNGLGAYWQDKWQLTPNLTLTYGVRWDGTWNPQPQTPIPGQQVWVGQGAGSKLVPVPQKTPNDFEQWGPRVGIAWRLMGDTHPTVLRASWGYYYAQTPTIFFPQASNGGGSIAAQLFCPPIFGCTVPAGDGEGGFPYLFPSALPFSIGDLCNQIEGCPSITYSDPNLRNPRVSNLTVGIEHSFSSDWNVSANYVFVHSTRLRTGGFSTTIWGRNFIPANGAAPGTAASEDPLGRTILAALPAPTSCAASGGEIFGPSLPADCSLFADTALASFSHGNYHEFVASVNKRFSNRFELFANYTWSRNYSNASSERDTDSFFGPQDPFNLNLDYGRSSLDMTHQLKAGVVSMLPWGVSWSNNFIAHSGLAYPAYIAVDINGDAITNQGFGSNDRPSVQLGSGKPFLLPDYPGREPNYFGWDMRISKDFNFSEKYQLRVSADLFNVTNRGNLYSNPDHSAFVDQPGGCTLYPNSITSNCPPLTALPAVGQISVQNGGTAYRTLDELTPGATPFAVQFGARFQF